MIKTSKLLIQGVIPFIIVFLTSAGIALANIAMEIKEPQTSDLVTIPMIGCAIMGACFLFSNFRK